MPWSCGLLDKRQDKPTPAHPPLRLAVDSSPAGQLGWSITLEGAWLQLGGLAGGHTSSLGMVLLIKVMAFVSGPQNRLHLPAGRAQEMAERKFPSIIPQESEGEPSEGLACDATPSCALRALSIPGVHWNYPEQFRDSRAG